MKKYLLDAKRWAWKKKYVISDEWGELQFVVKSQPFSFSNRLSFQQANGVEIFTIRRKIWSFLYKHIIVQDGIELASLHRKSVFGKNKFLIDSAGEFDYEVKGNFWSSEYVILKDGLIVAEVSKRKFKSEYLVRIDENEKEAFQLAVVVILDRILMVRRAQRSSA